MVNGTNANGGTNRGDQEADKGSNRDLLKEMNRDQEHVGHIMALISGLPAGPAENLPQLEMEVRTGRKRRTLKPSSQRWQKTSPRNYYSKWWAG
mmetsp:Transcript_24689/g.72252  ORF Transcript_24689/g.72252 Transcript_24689/m.72252 type:complete len:94 (+) Transcript_24689:2388-2669(+)